MTIPDGKEEIMLEAGNEFVSAFIMLCYGYTIVNN